MKVSDTEVLCTFHLKEETRHRYEEFARRYTLAETLPELLGVKGLRQKPLQGPSGKALARLRSRY